MSTKLPKTLCKGVLFVNIPVVFMANTPRAPQSKIMANTLFVLRVFYGMTTCYTGGTPLKMLPSYTGGTPLKMLPSYTGGTSLNRAGGRV